MFRDRETQTAMSSHKHVNRKDTRKSNPPSSDRAAEARSESVQRRGAQVLVIDDEVVVRRVVTDYLEGKGYSVASVDSGESALEWLRENEPGVILLDIFMPGVNGLEVLRALKKDRPKAQVLVISGFADEELERKVKALGAVDCLRKPFDFATLHTIVASRLGQRAR